MTDPETPDPQAALMATLVGRTITRTAWYDASPDNDWSGHDEGLIWFDDGRVIKFVGWGYDAWGADVYQIELATAEACLHCGERHEDREVFTRDNGERYAFCTDDNSVAWADR